MHSFSIERILLAEARGSAGYSFASKIPLDEAPGQRSDFLDPFLVPIHDGQCICHLLWRGEYRYAGLLHFNDILQCELFSSHTGEDWLALVVDALQGINIVSLVSLPEALP